MEGGWMKTRREVEGFRSKMLAAPTPAEQLLWEAMQQRWKRRSERQRQAIIGPFIADFYVERKLLIVEVDGLVHLAQRASDRRRDAFLAGCGFTVLRVSNDEVLADVASVVDRIAAVPKSAGTRKDRVFLWQSARSKAARKAHAMRQAS
jgi:very-short-patch-repair endonuclease